MSVTSKHRGHKIIFDGDNWIYSDTKELVSKNKDRACGNCGKEATEKGHDGCLGELPGLMNACCSHGVEKEAYIQFKDGASLHGKNAITVINLMKQSINT